MSSQKITILDGGIGCELQAMGAPFRKPEWSALALMEAPETVAQAHQAFIDAGAEVITTNAYAICPFHLGDERFEKEASALTNLCADIARTVANKAERDIKVAGCLPPVFGSYRPDLFNAEKANDLYKPLIEQQENFIDFWLAETMASIEEAQTVHNLTKPTNKPLWLAYTLADKIEDGKSGALRSGESIKEAVQAAIDMNVEALLFNCSQPEVMTPALKTVKEMNIKIPYGVYANTFPKKTKNYLANDSATPSKMREDITTEEYLSLAKDWVNLGATIIGGCCGIGPNHIKKLTKLNR